MSNLQDIPLERQRGAKTRAGTPCQNWGMRNGRCRMHGGKSYGGMASPRFKHGWHSNDPIYRCIRLAIEARHRQVRRLRKRHTDLGLDPDLADRVG